MTYFAWGTSENLKIFYPWSIWPFLSTFLSALHTQLYVFQWGILSVECESWVWSVNPECGVWILSVNPECGVWILSVECESWVWSVNPKCGVWILSAECHKFGAFMMIKPILIVWYLRIYALGGNTETYWEKYMF